VFAYPLEFKNVCIVSVFELVLKLQTLFDVAVTKEFMENLCSLTMPLLLSTEVDMEDYLYLERWRNP